jgi:Protein of unknown function (DUF2442)
MSSVDELVRVTEVEPLEKYVLRISFDDGKELEVDVEEFLRGPVFESVREDPALFHQVRVESGTIVWPNGADIDPVVLRGFAEPAWKEGDQGPRRVG